MKGKIAIFIISFLLVSGGSMAAIVSSAEEGSEAVKNEPVEEPKVVSQELTETLPPPVVADVIIEPPVLEKQSQYVPQAVIKPDGTTVFENGETLAFNVDEWIEEIDEKEFFYKLVEAEAGNQSTLGRRLVADCVLNQMDFYGGSIKDIILKENSFECVSNAHIFRTTAAKSTKECCDMEFENRIDYQVMYFRTEHYHTFGVPYEQVGDHFFSLQEEVTDGL